MQIVLNKSKAEGKEIEKKQGLPCSYEASKDSLRFIISDA